MHQPSSLADWRIRMATWPSRKLEGDMPVSQGSCYCKTQKLTVTTITDEDLGHDLRFFPCSSTTRMQWQVLIRIRHPVIVCGRSPVTKSIWQLRLSLVAWKHGAFLSRRLNYQVTCVTNSHLALSRSHTLLLPPGWGLEIQRHTTTGNSRQ